MGQKRGIGGETLGEVGIASLIGWVALRWLKRTGEGGGATENTPCAPR